MTTNRRRFLASLLGTAAGLAAIPSQAAIGGVWIHVNSGAPAPQVLVAASPAWTTTSPLYRYLNDLDATTGAPMATLSPPQYGHRGFATPRMEYGWLGQIGRDDLVAAAVANGTVSATTMPSAVAVPIMQWISPAATDTIAQGGFKIQVQAFAAASDGIRGGVPSVDFWVNDSAPVNVSAMTSGTIQVYGGTQNIPVFEVLVPFIEGAVLDFYARANVTPEMAARGMQPRVIGPMRIYCQSAYDAEANLFAPGSTNPAAINLNPTTFTPGANYDNPGKAANAIAKWSGWKPTGSQVRIKAVEDMVHDIGGTYTGSTVVSAFDNNLAKTIDRRGRLTIDGNGFNVLFNSSRWQNAGGTGNNNNMRFQYNGLTLANLKIDTARMGTWMSYQGEKLVNLLDNVEMYGASMLEMPGADGTQMCPRFPVFTGLALVQLTRCYIHDMSAGDLTLPARIGTKLRNYAGDAASPGQTPGANGGLGFRIPLQFVAENMDYVSSIPNTVPTQVMSLQYTPGGGTYAIRGTQQSPSNSSDARTPRTLALRLNGQDVSGGTFTFAYPGQVGGIHSISDLANAINAWSAANAGGAWVATPIGDASVYNRLRATFICTQRYQTGNTYPQNTQWSTSLNSTPDDTTKPDVPVEIGIWTGVPQHPDLIQIQGQDNADNVLYSSVTATRFNTQGLTIQPVQSVYDAVTKVTYITSYKMSNIALVQVAYNSDTNGIDFQTLNAYFGGNLNHCLIVNNTSPSGNGFLINCVTTDFMFDQFCRIDSNYNTTTYFKTSSTSAGVPLSTYSAQLQGQIRRNRALHNYQKGYTTAYDFTLYGEAVNNDNIIMDTSIEKSGWTLTPKTNTLATADYPAISHGLFADGTAVMFAISDFTPAPGGLLRQPSNRVKSQIPFDGFGRLRLDYDLAGPVALAA